MTAFDTVVSALEKHGSSVNRGMARCPRMMTGPPACRSAAATGGRWSTATPGATSTTSSASSDSPGPTSTTRSASRTDRRGSSPPTTTRDEAGAAAVPEDPVQPKDFRVRRPDGRGGWRGDRRRAPRAVPAARGAGRDRRGQAVSSSRARRTPTGPHGISASPPRATTKGPRRTGSGRSGARRVHRAAPRREGDRRRGQRRPGYAHARAIVAALAAGRAAVRLSGVAVDRLHADLSDHLNAGHGLARTGAARCREVPEPLRRTEPETPPLTCEVPQVPEVPAVRSRTARHCSTRWERSSGGSWCHPARPRSWR